MIVLMLFIFVGNFDFRVILLWFLQECMNCQSVSGISFVVEMVFKKFFEIKESYIKIIFFVKSDCIVWKNFFSILYFLVDLFFN